MEPATIAWLQIQEQHAITVTAALASCGLS